MTRERRLDAREKSLKAEIRDYADRLVAAAPPLSQRQLEIVVGALRPPTAAPTPKAPAEGRLSLHGDVDSRPLTCPSEALDSDGVRDGQTADGLDILAEGSIGSILSSRDSIDLSVQPFVNLHDKSPVVGAPDGAGVGASQLTEGKSAGIKSSGAPSMAPERQERNHDGCISD